MIPVKLKVIAVKACPQFFFILLSEKLLLKVEFL